MKPKFRGIYIPTLTTFTEDGEVDFPMVGELLEFLVSSKVHGLFVLGSTGMGPVMTTKQRIETAEFVVKQIRGRLPIIMHVGTADVQTTTQLAKHADSLGVDAVAVVPPFYFTDHTFWEVTAHYKAVASVIKNPLFLYDNVKYSGFRFTPASTKKLLEEVPSLCGMKASYYSQASLLEYLDVMPKDFTVMSGNTVDLLPAVPHGLSGAIPPLTTAIPEIIVALWNSLEAGKFTEAVALQNKADQFGRTVAKLGGRFGRTAHREAHRLRGFKIKRYPRWPTENLTEEAMETLAQALKATGL